MRCKPTAYMHDDASISQPHHVLEVKTFFYLDQEAFANF